MGGGRIHESCLERRRKENPVTIARPSSPPPQRRKKGRGEKGAYNGEVERERELPGDLHFRGEEEEEEEEDGRGSVSLSLKSVAIIISSLSFSSFLAPLPPLSDRVNLVWEIRR